MENRTTERFQSTHTGRFFFLIVSAFLQREIFTRSFDAIRDAIDYQS